MNKRNLLILEKAINCYSFPKVIYDIKKRVPVKMKSMREVEDLIKKQLVSGNPELVKSALSNVLYWGYNRSGYGEHRMNVFRDEVQKPQLEAFMKLLKDDSMSLVKIQKLRMSQFSGMSFISKIMMFLDPKSYVVLDLKLIQLKDESTSGNPLNRIKFGIKDTTIRITCESEDSYFQWCKLCKEISHEYFDGKYRPVDIERGFFEMIERRQIDEGRMLIGEFIKELQK